MRQILMWARLDQFGVVLLDACVSATLFLGFVTLLMMICRQPARRLLVARVSLIAVLCIIPADALRIIPRFDLLGTINKAGLLPHTAFSRQYPRLSEKIPAIGPRITAEVDYLPTAAPFFSGSKLSRSLLLLYFAGVAFSLARLSLGWGMLAVLRRKATEASELSLSLYQSLPFPQRRVRPQLQVVSRIRRPVLVGLLRPVILIPPELDQPEMIEALRLTLLHELAHAEGSDPWHGFLANLSQVFWFFLPPIWWVWARMRLDQEFVADHRAAVGFGHWRDYAAALLEIALQSTRRNAELGEPCQVAAESTPSLKQTHTEADPDASPIYQRVSMLLRCPFPIEARPPRYWSFAFILLILALSVGSMSLSVRPLSSTVSSKVNTFRMERLELEAAAVGEGGRAPLFELPIRLPETFDLIVEIWGDIPSLSQTRVAGLCLQPDPVHALDEPPSDMPDWHNVHVRRGLENVEVWIDGHPGLLNSDPIAITAWLSVEPPPGLEGFYRNLTLTW